MLRSSNPAMNIDRLQGVTSTSGGVMTVQGSINKTLMLLGITMLASVFSWRVAASGGAAAHPLILLGSIGGLLMVVVTSFKMSWAPATAPMYAILEGVCLGSLSGLINQTQQWHGLPGMALLLTFAVLGCMLVAYKTEAIVPTQRLRAGATTALLALLLVSCVTILLKFIGVTFFYDALYLSGSVGILFSIGVIVLASIFLILDFDFIVKGAEAGAPAYVEWYGAMGLLITLVWLYLEILNLLMKMRSRR